MFKQLVTCDVPEKFPKYYLYKLIFKSGKTYIGQHTQRKENDSYISSSVYLQKLKENNDELLVREIFLYVKDKETLDFMETWCIMNDKVYNKNKNINGNLGSYSSKSYVAGWNKGIKTGKLSEKTRKRMSDAHKGIIFSEEHKKHISEGCKGRTISEKQRKKQSEKMKGRVPYNKGMKMSDEFKRKCSESHKGKAVHKVGTKMSDEFKRKCSESHKGKKPWNKGIKMSEEFREKCRNRQVGKSAKNKGERGRKCWNNGERTIMVFDNPGNGWVLGRLKK